MCHAGLVSSGVLTSCQPHSPRVTSRQVCALRHTHTHTHTHTIINLSLRIRFKAKYASNCYCFVQFPNKILPFRDHIFNKTTAMYISLNRQNHTWLPFCRTHPDGDNSTVRNTFPGPPLLKSGFPPELLQRQLSVKQV